MAKDPTLVPLEKENKDFEKSVASLSFDVALQDCTASLNLKALVSGYEVRSQEERFIHPLPPFCRVFLFFEQGGRILIDKTEHEFIPGRIYWLSDNHPFEVTYFAGSELLYAHVSVTDYTLQSVFSEAPGLRCAVLPELVPLLKRAWELRDPVKIAALLGTVFSEFLPFEMPILSRRYEVYRFFGPLFRKLAEIPPANLRVSELAELMRMTPSALSKSFKRHIGVSPKEYLHTIYLRRARELLIYSSYDMEEIAKKLGHEDVHYFYHLFKHFTGTSPARFRKRYVVK